MTHRIAITSILPLIATTAHAQDSPKDLGAAAPIASQMRAGETGDDGITPAGPIVASLTYDGSSSESFLGQDFETVFDCYDQWVCERIAFTTDVQLREFRSIGLATRGEFLVTDVTAALWLADTELCERGRVTPAFRSIPGAGFFDGTTAITTFDATCVPAGDYIIGWQARMDFDPWGQIQFFAQSGAHDNGIGSPNDGFRNTPLACNFPECSDTRTLDGEPTGINFILFGEIASCDNPCEVRINDCGDVDGDGDSDPDDFFIYLDMFASGDPCADIDQDTDIDAEDFFAYLDLFVNPC